MADLEQRLKELKKDFKKNKKLSKKSKKELKKEIKSLKYELKERKSNSLGVIQVKKDRSISGLVECDYKGRTRKLNGKVKRYNGKIVKEFIYDKDFGCTSDAREYALKEKKLIKKILKLSKKHKADAFRVKLFEYKNGERRVWDYDRIGHDGPMSDYDLENFSKMVPSYKGNLEVFLYKRKK